VSYSAIDLTVKLWKVGNTGFFNSIMGSTGKCSKEIKLKPIRNWRNPHQHLADAGSSNRLFGSEGGAPNRGGSSTTSDHRVNKCYIKFISKNEKEVELLREDGSKEILKTSR